MQIYNLDKLIKVVVNDISPAAFIYFKKEKRFFGALITREGFYEWPFDEFIGTETPKNYIFKNGVLYDKPEVVLVFQEGYKKRYIFDTYEEANNFAKDLTNTRNWIE